MTYFLHWRQCTGFRVCHFEYRHPAASQFCSIIRQGNHRKKSCDAREDKKFSGKLNGLILHKGIWPTWKCLLPKVQLRSGKLFRLVIFLREFYCFQTDVQGRNWFVFAKNRKKEKIISKHGGHHFDLMVSIMKFQAQPIQAQHFWWEWHDHALFGKEEVSWLPTGQ